MFWRAVLFSYLVTNVMCACEDNQTISIFIDSDCNEKKAEESLNTYKQCARSQFDEKIISDIQNMKTNTDILDVFKQFCGKTPELRTCLFTFINSMEQCVKSEYREELNKSKKLLDDMIEYGCGDNHQKFTDFVDGGGLDCVRDKYDILKGCVVDLIYNFHNRGKGLNNLTEVCARLDVFRECIHKNLEECPKKSAVSHFEELTELIRKYSACALHKVTIDQDNNL